MNGGQVEESSAVPEGRGAGAGSIEAKEPPLALPGEELEIGSKDVSPAGEWPAKESEEADRPAKKAKTDEAPGRGPESFQRSMSPSPNLPRPKGAALPTPSATPSRAATVFGSPSHGAASRDKGPERRQQEPLREHPPTTSMYVSNFVRPFTLPQVKELLGSYGEPEFFWMDAVKSHCYVTVCALPLSSRSR